MPESKQEIALKQINRIKDLLTKSGLIISEPVQNEYSYQIFISNDKEKISLHNFYGKKGNKTLVQGNKDLKLYREVNNLIFGEKLIDEIKPETEPEYAYIGTDESGKGDYFGPLVIAGVYVTPESGKILKALGVRDSKELGDTQIKKLSADIRKSENVIYDVILISPEKYNQLYEKMGNLNRLMGWGHAKVIENLLNKSDATEVISDKFGNERIILDALQDKGRLINLKQITKAEKFTAVAAASVLAREAFIDWFFYQRKKYKIDFPKGSSLEVETTAKDFLSEYGEENLKKLVKVHFKTSQKIFNTPEN